MKLFIYHIQNIPEVKDERYVSDHYVLNDYSLKHPQIRISIKSHFTLYRTTSSVHIWFIGFYLDGQYYPIHTLVVSMQTAALSDKVK